MARYTKKPVDPSNLGTDPNSYTYVDGYGFTPPPPVITERRMLQFYANGLGFAVLFYFLLSGFVPFLLLRLSQNGKLKGDAAKVDLFKEISVPVEDGSVEGQMFKRSDFGLRFGVGVTVMKHYYAGVGYDLGLLNISKDSGEGKIKNGSFFISLGYNF